VTALAAVAILLASSATSRAQSGSLEYAVKATYVFKFPPFVTWPAGAFATASSPITFCVVGASPFGEQLERVAAGQKIDDHPITVRHLAAIAVDSGCQVVYVGNGGSQTLLEAVSVTRTAPILTVTDGVRDVRARGIINFVMEDNRVRFEIDNTMAVAGGLVISSKLLSLAVPIRSRE
jgi:hypothetical protein